MHRHREWRSPAAIGSRPASRRRSPACAASRACARCAPRMCVARRGLRRTVVVRRRAVRRPGRRSRHLDARGACSTTPSTIGYVRRGRATRELPRDRGARPERRRARASCASRCRCRPEADVVEAYLLLDRVHRRGLRSRRPWRCTPPASSTRGTRARSRGRVQPRIEEVGAPVTRVLPASGALVRLDVRAHRRAMAARRPRTQAATSGWRDRSRRRRAAPAATRGMAFALAPAAQAVGRAAARSRRRRPRAEARALPAGEPVRRRACYARAYP